MRGLAITLNALPLALWALAIIQSMRTQSHIPPGMWAAFAPFLITLLALIAPYRRWLNILASIPNALLLILGTFTVVRLWQDPTAYDQSHAFAMVLMFLIGLANYVALRSLRKCGGA
jgi:hypothetical protein